MVKRKATAVLQLANSRLPFTPTPPQALLPSSTNLPPNSVLRTPLSTTPPLSRQNLIIMRPQVQTSLLPRSIVRTHADTPTAPPLVIDPVGNVLPEGGRARDRRLVDLLVLPQLVGVPTGAVGADLGPLCRALAVGRPFLYVVLDQGVAGPAVDGEEDGAGGAGAAARVGDGSGRSIS
jgi:hypothetical protein